MCRPLILFPCPSTWRRDLDMSGGNLIRRAVTIISINTSNLVDTWSVIKSFL